MPMLLLLLLLLLLPLIYGAVGAALPPLPPLVSTPAPPTKAPFKVVDCTSGGGRGECPNVDVRCTSGSEVVGQVCMGQCWLPIFGCKTDHCRKGSPKDRCNEYLPEQCGGKCEGST